MENLKKKKPEKTVNRVKTSGAVKMAWEIGWAQRASKGDYKTYLKLLKQVGVTGKKRKSGYRVKKGKVF